VCSSDLVSRALSNWLHRETVQAARCNKRSALRRLPGITQYIRRNALRLLTPYRLRKWRLFY